MTDDAEILAAFDAPLDALTVQRDAAASIAGFATDDDIWMSGSELDELAIGREAIAALHSSVTTMAARLTFKWRVRRVRQEGDVAWVNAAGELFVEPDTDAAYTIPYRITVVLVRRDGAWLWHTMNGSEPHTS